MSQMQHMVKCFFSLNIVLLRTTQIRKYLFNNQIKWKNKFFKNWGKLKSAYTDQNLLHHRNIQTKHLRFKTKISNLIKILQFANLLFQTQKSKQLIKLNKTFLFLPLIYHIFKKEVLTTQDASDWSFNQIFNQLVKADAATNWRSKVATIPL